MNVDAKAPKDNSEKTQPNFFERSQVVVHGLIFLTANLIIWIAMAIVKIILAFMLFISIGLSIGFGRLIFEPQTMTLNIYGLFALLMAWEIASHAVNSFINIYEKPEEPKPKG